VLLLKNATGVISHGDAFAMLAQIQEELSQSTIVQNVVGDHTILKTFINDAIRRAELPDATIVTTRLQIVPNASYTSRSIQENLRGLMSFWINQLAAAFEEISRNRHLRARCVIPSQGQPAGSGTIEEIARDLIAVAACHEHVLFMVPFDPITGKSNRGILLSRSEAGVSVSREPSIYKKPIPTSQVQAITLVIGEHRMADTETPDAHQAGTVATETCDLAPLDAEAVFMFCILRSVYEESVNIPAQSAAIES
jgi:hypothetical protein